MERWHHGKSDFVEDPKVDAFLEDILTVCRKHHLLLSHEDGHGAFLICEYSEGDPDWLRHADIEKTAEDRRTDQRRLIKREKEWKESLLRRQTCMRCGRVGRTAPNQLCEECCKQMELKYE